MPSTSQTNVSLLERLREGGDPLAWREFFERYWRAVYGYAKRCRCSDHTADEVVQEVMLTVFENRQVFKYDPTLGRFRNWLRKVASQKIALRRRRKSPATADGDAVSAVPSGEDQPDQVWETVFENALLFALLEAVRQETNPKTYQAFELTTLYELPGAEVARLTGISRNAVYLAHKRVLRRLRVLGARYRNAGKLQRCLKELLEQAPPAAAERNLTRQVETTMQSPRMPSS